MELLGFKSQCFDNKISVREIEAYNACHDQAKLPFNTPFKPKDYTRNTYKFDFSSEYHESH